MKDTSLLVWVVDKKSKQPVHKLKIVCHSNFILSALEMGIFNQNAHVMSLTSPTNHPVLIIYFFLKQTD